MKEWIITNGIGGFASSTDYGGMNTRKYHGLLIASMTPPYNRKLILSKVDESIEINGNKINLYTNEANGEITEGYKNLIKFEKDIIPIYTYKVSNVIIEKSICMIHGKNAVAVIYRVSNQKKKIKLNLTPIINDRDFHALSTMKKFKYTQEVSDNFEEVKVKFEDLNINLYVKGAKYEKKENDIFYDMQYRVEKERGFDYSENHAIPGTFTVEIKPNEDKEIVFLCSIDGKYGISSKEMQKYSGPEIIENELKRINSQISDSQLIKKAPKKVSEKEAYKDLVKKYITAVDNFIVYKNSTKLHTVIAGYPWFNEWFRDTLISFEGLLLIPKKFDIAEEVLLGCIKNIKDGLIPNGYSEYTGRPLYNSADASLLFFEAVQKYIDYTGNYDFVKEKLYKHMKTIINNYIDGINISDNNIYLDDIDYLIVSGTANTQNTWMDVKIDNKVITPRNGKAVEINALFYNALKVMQNINKNYGNKIAQMEYAYIAKKCKKSFEKAFYNIDKKCLYDVIGDDKIRPNQLFAISLSYPVLDCNDKVAKEMFITVTKKLLNKYGLMTLAKGEEGFIPKYEGNPYERDCSYHQGTIWPWLLGIYYNALKNLIKYDEDEENKEDLKKTLEEFKENVAKVFTNELINGNTYGSICEVYDAIRPKQGKGAFAQAWSVAEVFRILFDK